MSKIILDNVLKVRDQELRASLRAWQERHADDWKEDTVCGLFVRAVAANPDHVFLHPVKGRQYTYLESLQITAQIAELLSGLGVKRGDRIVTYLEQTVPLIFMYLASSLMGVVAAPLSEHFSLRYLKGMVDDLDGKVVLGLPQSVPALREELAIPVLVFGTDSIDGSRTVSSNPTMAPSRVMETLSRLCAPCKSSDTFMIQPTSGSTGKPKLVVRPHAGFVRYAHYLNKEIDSPGDRQEVFLAVQCLTHAFALHNLTAGLKVGAKMAIPSSLDTNAALHDVWEMRPTILAMVPRVLRSFYRQHLHEKASSPMMKLFPPTARVLFSAGGKSDAELLEYCQFQGLSILEYYGSSEASLVALTPRGGWRASCAGVPVSDVKLKFMEDGEILISSPGLFSSYLGEEEQTKEAVQNGMYRSGDCGELTSDGYLRILGRKKDIFNTPEGSNIFPVRIENLVEKAVWADQVMLVGDQRPYLTAYVVLNDQDLQTDEADGYLSPKLHTALYVRLGRQLEQINEHLERVENIVYFMLFTKRFPESGYLEVGQGKVRRNRKAFEESYDRRVKELYAKDLQFLGECRRVPRSDRRLREKTQLRNTVSEYVRVHPRLLCEINVHVSVDKKQCACVVRDLGRGGLALDGDLQGVFRGDVLVVRGTLRKQPFSIEGVVKWAHQGKCGIQFSGEGLDSAPVLEQYLTELEHIANV